MDPHGGGPSADARVVVGCLGVYGRSAGLAASEFAELGRPIEVFGDVGLGTISVGLGAGAMFFPGDENSPVRC